MLAGSHWCSDQSNTTSSGPVTTTRVRTGSANGTGAAAVVGEVATVDRSIVVVGAVVAAAVAGTVVGATVVAEVAPVLVESDADTDADAGEVSDASDVVSSLPAQAATTSAHAPITTPTTPPPRMGADRSNAGTTAAPGTASCVAGCVAA
jgi:hypothetical protein